MAIVLMLMVLHFPSVFGKSHIEMMIVKRRIDYE